MGISEFYDLTPREFWLAMQGYIEEEQEHYRHDYEVARLNATLVLFPYVKRGSRLKPQDLIEFGWEHAKGVRKLQAGVKNPKIKEMMLKKYSKKKHGR